MAQRYNRNGSYVHNGQQNQHHNTGRGRKSNAWKWWTGAVIAAVIYTNNGGDLGQLFSGLVDGTGAGGGSPAPVTHSVPADNGGGGYKAPCTQYFKGGC